MDSWRKQVNKHQVSRQVLAALRDDGSNNTGDGVYTMARHDRKAQLCVSASRRNTRQKKQGCTVSDCSLPTHNICQERIKPILNCSYTGLYIAVGSNSTAVFCASKQNWAVNTAINSEPRPAEVRDRPGPERGQTRKSREK